MNNSGLLASDLWMQCLSQLHLSVPLQDRARLHIGPEDWGMSAREKSLGWGAGLWRRSLGAAMAGEGGVQVGQVGGCTHSRWGCSTRDEGRGAGMAGEGKEWSLGYGVTCGVLKIPQKVIWVTLGSTEVCTLFFCPRHPSGIKLHALWLYKPFADFPVSYEVWLRGNEGRGGVVFKINFKSFSRQERKLCWYPTALMSSRHSYKWCGTMTTKQRIKQINGLVTEIYHLLWFVTEAE